MNDIRRLFKRLSLDIVIFLLPVFSIIYLFPKVFSLFLPFICGFFLYLLAKPINKRLLKAHFPPFLSSLISILIICFLLAGIIWLFLFFSFKELTSLSISYGAFPQSIRLLTNKTSYLSEITSSFRTQLFDVLGSLLKSVLEYAKNLPRLLISGFSAILTGYFFLKDKDVIASFLLKLFGESFYCKCISYKNKVCRTLFLYIKAGLLVESIIFAILFLGLVLLRVRYAFIISFLIALVDILPIFGAGIVLIPWSLFSFLSGSTALGWGLLALYGICLITRQIAEPKIIGTRLGIHPLASILSIYIGMRFFGVLGIFLGPAIALFIKSIIKEM